MMLICIDFTTDSARCIFEWLWLRRPVRAWKFGWTAIPLTLFDHLTPSLGAFQLFFFAAHLRILVIATLHSDEYRKPTLQPFI